MTREWRIALGVLGLIVVPGGFYAGITVYLLTKIDYGVYSFKISDINNKTVKGSVTVWVKNPANVAIEIEGYDLNIGINGIDVVSIKNQDKKIIEPKQTSYLTIPIEFSHDKFVNKIDWTNLVTNFVVGKSEKIIFSLKGKFIGGVFGLPISRKVNVKKSLREIAEQEQKNKLTTNK